jgi:hypothetical protein
MFAFMSSLWWSFLPQFRGVILWGREKKRERERERIKWYLFMHVGCNSNYYFPNFSCGLDHYVLWTLEVSCCIKRHMKIILCIKMVLGMMGCMYFI